ncbi:MAG: enoyl-CoA hydratase/isomerase family protein [Bacteroidetes bacterium]|nr:enoyl-CoA hydratase/isomerase family protein [Bacteroidota bacterium]
MAAYELIKTTLEHPILRIVLNRPEKRNALSPTMIAEISAALDDAAADGDVRVVILSGEGGTFCAGADLAYIQQLSSFGAEENLSDSRALRDLYWKIYTFPKIVIAQVHGPALAGGCGLATVCDMVFASDDSQFGYTETAIGFIPALVSVFLIRKIGEQHARELLLSARKVSAEEAYSLGMINAVVPCPELEATVQSYALAIAKNSPSAIGLTKTLLSTVSGMSMEPALEYAASMNALARSTDDCKKGIAKFLNK